MNWKLKATIQNVLSAVPGGADCNYLLQRTVGTYLHPEARVKQVFEKDIVSIMRRFAEMGCKPGETTVLEIGTGWMPILPLCLSLAGFTDVRTLDIKRHLRSGMLLRTLRALESFLSSPSILQFSSAEDVRQRFEKLSHCADMTSLLKRGGIQYYAPRSAADTHLPDESIDLIVSNNVFEHIPAPELRAIMKESRRILREGGRIVHWINCGDHYAYADPAVTQVNYLQFSDREWLTWNNSIHYQNRLRPSDFVEMASEAVFRIEVAVHPPKEPYLKQLAGMKVAAEFERYPIEELAATSIHLTARRQADCVLKAEIVAPTLRLPGHPNARKNGVRWGP